MRVKAGIQRSESSTVALIVAMTDLSLLDLNSPQRGGMLWLLTSLLQTLIQQPDTVNTHTLMHVHEQMRNAL